MKKLIILLSFLLLAITVEGQMILNARTPARAQVTASGGAVYTDDFEAYTDGALATQGNWIAGYGTISVADNAGDVQVYGNTAGDISAAIYNDTFADDQYAEITIDAKAGAPTNGVGVRMSGSAATFDGYLFVINEGDGYLMEVTDGSFAVLVTIATPTYSIGDVIRLEISGTTLSMKKNGSLWTEFDTDGLFTDASISTGRAGVAGFSSGGSARMDNWEGGDL